MKTSMAHRQPCDCDICFYQKKILKDVCEELLKLKVMVPNTKSEDFMEGLGFGVKKYFENINEILNKNLSIPKEEGF